jgi:hypothetical protein
MVLYGIFVLPHPLLGGGSVFVSKLVITAKAHARILVKFLLKNLLQ